VGPLLEVRSLTKRFGGLTAVAGLDFDLREGEILG
jgi:ABC-type branched-subunit amino acid transport system ATPase component